MEKILEELQQIGQQNGGLIRPIDVVNFARDPDTALHARFTWDDDAAAEKWRLLQARQVINVHVKVLAANTESVKAFVSLSEDRKLPGGGYRAIEDVLGDEQKMESLLAMAQAEMQSFRRKYQALAQLAPVFKAMQDAEAAMEVAKPTARRRAATQTVAAHV